MKQMRGLEDLGTTLYTPLRYSQQADILKASIPDPFEPITDK
jgi:hypothetical protein